MIDRLHHFLPGWALAFASSLRAAWPDVLITLTAPLRRLPRSFIKRGPPRDMVSMDELVGNHRARLHAVDEERWSLNGPPGAAEKRGGNGERIERVWRSGVAELEEGRVLAPDGAVITSDDRVVRDYSRIIGRPRKPHPALGRLWLPEVDRFHGRLAVLQVHQAENYYHWILEVLPRLGLLRAAAVEVDGYYVSARTKFQRESLALAGVPLDKVRSPVEHLHMAADCLVVPSRPEVGQPSPHAIQMVRQLFGAERTRRVRRRIYVTRRLAARRHVLNEGEIESILNSFGVEIIETEKLDFAGQARVFAEAEWVIAPHGAGLSNLVFSEPGTRVLELFSNDYVNPCYWALAGAAGLRYDWLAGGDGVLRQGAHGRSGIRVSVDRFERLLTDWSRAAS